MNKITSNPVFINLVECEFPLVVMLLILISLNYMHNAISIIIFYINCFLLSSLVIISINTKVIFHENLYFNLEDFNQKTSFKNLFIILSSPMLFFMIRKIRFI